MSKIKRLATQYLQVGDLVIIPDHIPAPIVYTEQSPNGKTVRMGRVSEILANGALAINLEGKVWDYSNKEALQFSRAY